MTSSNQSVSAERGALKVFGVLFIVLGVVYLISGGVMIAGARVVDTTQTVAVADGLDLNVMVWSLALAIWWLICGLFYIVFGALGIRGAKNPAKIGVFTAAAGSSSIFTGAVPITTWIPAVVSTGAESAVGFSVT